MKPVKIKGFTKQQVQVARLAFGLSGLPCENHTAETAMIVLSQIKTLGAKFNVYDAVMIEAFIAKKYGIPGNEEKNHSRKVNHQREI